MKKYSTKEELSNPGEFAVEDFTIEENLEQAGVDATRLQQARSRFDIGCHELEQRTEDFR